MSASKFKMLWVYQQVSTGRGVRLEAGQKPSLCFKGRKHTFCVSAGHPVRVIKRDASDFDRLREVRKGASLYAVSAAVAQFRAIARRCGITKGAEEVLARAEAARTLDDIEETLTNEEELTAMNENPTPVIEPAASVENVEKPKRKRAAKAAKETVVSKKTSKKTKAPRKSSTPRAQGNWPKALPIIAAEFMKLKPADRKDRPRGFGKGVMEKLMARLDVNKNMADAYYWKAIWNCPKELGL